MMTKPSLKMFLICGAIFAGVLSIPVGDAEVTRHTTLRLARDLLPTLWEGAEEPGAVVWNWQGDPAIGEEVKALFQRYAYADVVASDAPRLSLTLQEIDGEMVLEGAVRNRHTTVQARKGNAVSLLPPLLAVLLALLFKNVILSMFVGVWAGVTVLQGGNPLYGLWATLSEYGWSVVTDTFNLQILGFTFGLVGMVAVVGRMGGTQGLVNAVSRFAKGPRSAQGVTGLMGTLIFFDDYANTLVVGTTARALTDRLRVSREKLAYIVDSTSAPVAGVAIISTWIGYEVGLFDSLLVELAHVPGIPRSGYALFFEILPLRFYCLFALALVFLTAATGRDFGPMLAAERRVRRGGPPIPPRNPEDGAVADAGASTLEKPGVPPRLLNAVLPIASVLGVIAYQVYDTGREAVSGSFEWFALEHWRLIFSKGADDIGAILLMASVIGGGVACLLSLGQRLLTPKEVVVAYGKGVGTLVEACAILILAWMIKGVCDDLGTGLALVGMIGDAVPAVALPVVIFLLAGVVAFSTGTSWGTMALLLPVAAPLATVLSGELPIVLACMGAVLDGAIWGDHCSPISDTTVLSSTATGCPHMAHVKTQLPYATLAMVTAGLVGYVGFALWELPCWGIYSLGVAGMLAALLLLGREAGDETSVKREETQAGEVLI